MTESEQIKKYMELPKIELCRMLINANWKIDEIRTVTTTTGQLKYEAIFLNALYSHPAYLHPKTRKRREVYLRKSFYFCCSKILGMKEPAIAKLIEIDRVTVIFAMKDFEENLRYNKMLLCYFRGYLASLLTELQFKLKLNFDPIFEKLIKVESVKQVMRVVYGLKKIIWEQIKIENKKSNENGK